MLRIWGGGVSHASDGGRGGGGGGGVVSLVNETEKPGDYSVWCYNSRCSSSSSSSSSSRRVDYIIGQMIQRAAGGSDA